MTMPNLAPSGPDPEPTRTLVVSNSAGTAARVAAALSQDVSLTVNHRDTSLADLARVPSVDIAATDLIIFDIRVGNEADLDALQTLRTMGHDNLKFLGITAQTLTLATARALMDAGVDEVIPMASIAPETPQPPPVEDPPPQRHAGDLHNGLIVAVCSARGGVGATTTALNLATQLARPPKGDSHGPSLRVAVIDLDIQNGVLGASLDVHDEGEVMDWLQSGTAPEEDFIPRSIKTYEAGAFDVMPAPLAFAPLDILQSEMLAALLDDLRLAYDFVILDLPRAVCEWIDAVLTRADKFLILTDHAVHTLRQTRRLMDTFTDEHPSLPIEVVVSKDSRTNNSTAALKEAEAFLDRKITNWIPRDDKSARRAADAGQPMLALRPRSPVAKALAPIVDSLKDAHASSTRRRA
ncbi:AAA family ATPase [Pseudooctadecabacter sp.]|uniref:AAA family ATPase n=1 Tax=Pseudooctadecabacter sp. TaxID=1966338 RepID=UPI0025EE9CDC|nr:AAA family ATPase [Pseudooctadecabacter sp.]